MLFKGGNSVGTTRRVQRKTFSASASVNGSLFTTISRQYTVSVDRGRQFPTLGEVAEEDRFSRVRELIETVKDTPVNELSEKLREKLLEGEEKSVSLVFEAFFAACDAKAEETKKNIELYGAAPVLEKLEELSEDRFYKPWEVPLPSLMEREEPPPFIPVNWVEETVNLILPEFGRADDGEARVPPMALVRCARGGKTRAEKELAHALKKALEEKAAIIYISLNDSSSIDNVEWEQADPVGALCRRIAFAALKDKTVEFMDFLVEVSESVIRKWLGNCPRILLIDELNLIESLKDEKSTKAKAVASFLKNFFLRQKDQYLIFSSHEIGLTNDLEQFMESKSKRRVIIRPLPQVPSVNAARKNFNFQSLTVQQALYYGLVPSLIRYYQVGGLLSKRDTAIRKCKDEGLVTNESMRELLESFLNGNPNLIPSPLQQLMTAEQKNEGGMDKGIVKWIPFQMDEVLKDFARVEGLKQETKDVLNEIARQFLQLRDAKRESGMAWESLFVIVLLIRAFTRQFHQVILPVSGTFAECSVSFNKFFEPELVKGNKTVTKSLEDCKNIEDLVPRITQPDHFPHIAIYVPSYAKFESVDVVVAAWSKAGAKSLYAYNLREGAELPDGEGSKVFEKIFAIRGDGPKEKETLTRNWTSPSEPQIEEFFGVSGANWTPNNLKRLMQEKD